MTKNYQTTPRRVRTGGRTTPKKARIDPQQQAHEAALPLPDTVTVDDGRLLVDLAALGTVQKAYVERLTARDRMVWGPGRKPPSGWGQVQRAHNVIMRSRLQGSPVLGRPQ